MSDIELVIKMPKIEYEHLTNKDKFSSLEKSKREWLINKTLNRVAEGTLLTKGRKLIDADAILEEIKYNKAEIAYLFDDDWDKGVEAISEILNKLMQESEE